MGCAGRQVDEYLLPCVTGEKKEVFALTEPGAGSDIMSMQTRATRVGDEFVINGRKHFISSPVKPDFAILFCTNGSHANTERRAQAGDRLPCGCGNTRVHH